MISLLISFSLQSKRVVKYRMAYQKLLAFHCIGGLRLRGLHLDLSPKHRQRCQDLRGKDGYPLHKMLSNKRPEVSDQRETFLALL